MRYPADNCCVNTVKLTPHGLVAGIKELATLPEVALRIARMVDDPTSSSADIGREISRDAALTARLLRIAPGRRGVVRRPRQQCCLRHAADIGDCASECRADVADIAAKRDQNISHWSGDAGCV